MKLIPVLSHGIQWLKISALLWLSFLIFPSCQKDEFGKELMNEDAMYKSGHALSSSSLIYFGPETFTIVSKDGVDKTIALAGDNFNDYMDFVLKVQNGTSGKTKVTKMEISIDGVVLVTYADFKKNMNIVTKNITGLTPTSRLKVKLEGSRGRFITIQIEGTSKTGTVNDYEGNQYKTVFICGRWWMAENLRATKFNDGTAIPEAQSNQEWIDYYNERSPAYCWYNNDQSNKEVYGALYNYAVGDNKVCPSGWHIPTGHDFFLICLNVDPLANENIGSYSDIAGGMLKEAGTQHWSYPNTGATNSTGFTGLPGGHRDYSGLFSRLGTYGVWWTDNCLAFLTIVYNNTNVYFSEGANEYGHSIRCIKDE